MIRLSLGANLGRRVIINENQNRGAASPMFEGPHSGNRREKVEADNEMRAADLSLFVLRRTVFQNARLVKFRVYVKSEGRAASEIWGGAQ